jgi:hypothetical protein
LDAAHFRQRAARAREMAQSGDDIQLSRMLLEVARELDAEAEAMESLGQEERRRFPRLGPPGGFLALLHVSGAEAVPVRIIDVSAGGARLRGNGLPALGSRVVLEVQGRVVRLEGRIVRARGSDAAMAFDPACSGDPALTRLLRSAAEMDRVRV